jgi:hypothetical protein
LLVKEPDSVCKCFGKGSLAKVFLMFIFRCLRIAGLRILRATDILSLLRKPQRDGVCLLSSRLPECLPAAGRYRPATATEIVETPLSFSSSDLLLPLCPTEDE